MIMKHAAAVVQPTRYEGSPGGGEVEDAVAVGMQAIVSDIPVNLEIEDDSVLFFHTGNEKDLSAKMKEAIERNWKIPEREELERQGTLRQNHYYEILKTMIDHTVR
jgi:glycosyltransferase involved in cell wall biosynthesis